MITENDVIEFIAENFHELFDFGKPLYNLDTDETGKILDILEDFEWDKSIVQDILEGLKVNDYEERLEWFNCPELNLDDIINLANVNFYTVECNNCLTKLWEGNPDSWSNFINAYNVEICHVEGELNGKSIDTDLCEKCYYTAKNMLDF